LLKEKGSFMLQERKMELSRNGHLLKKDRQKEKGGKSNG